MRDHAGSLPETRDLPQPITDAEIDAICERIEAVGIHARVLPAILPTPTEKESWREKTARLHALEHRLGRG